MEKGEFIFDKDKRHTVKEILDVIKELKKSKRYSIKDLADKLDVKTQVLSNWVYTTKQRLSKLSGKDREQFYSSIFQISSIQIQSTNEDNSSHFVSDTSKPLHFHELEYQLDHTKKENACLKNIISQKNKEQISLKRKVQRHSQRHESENEKLNDTICNLKAQISNSKTLESELKRSSCSLKKAEEKCEGLTAKIDKLIHENEQLATKIIDSHSNCSNCNVFIENNKELKKSIVEKNLSISYLENEVFQAQESNNIITTDNHGAFNSSVVKCVMELLDAKVSVHQVSPVINAVGELCGKSFSSLPSVTTINRINDRRASIAREQLSNVSNEKNTTLQSDETRKYGDTYETFCLNTSNKEYILGVREMSDKSANSCIETLEEIIEDINISSSSNSGNEIITNIKNTMSDRAPTEKKFQSLLENFRSEQLQSTDEWDDLTQSQKEEKCKMNNFYCGLHLLVNFAEIADKETKETEADKNEAVNFVRMACKCFARGGDEKNGIYKDFNTYLQRNENPNKWKNLLTPFKGNRFNILFQNAAALFFLHEDMKNFFSLHSPTNNLHRNLLDSLNNDKLLSIVKAFALLCKLVTSPFWRMLEEKGKGLKDTNNIYVDFQIFLKQAEIDSSEVMKGEMTPFPDMIIKDEAYFLLLQDSSFDNHTQIHLQNIFSAWLTHIEKAVKDHLPGGKYFLVDESLEAETTSTPTHNKLPERVFGLLDSLMRIRPGASTLCNETQIMCTINKTMDYVDSLAHEEQEKVINESRKDGIKIRKEFQRRRTAIENNRKENQKKKEIERNRKAKSKETLRQKLFNDIQFFGLWQTCEQVDEMVNDMKSSKEKRKALKSQLQFRKVMLQQAADPKLFLFSTNKKQKTIPELVKDVKTLIEMSLNITATGPSALVGKKIIHTFETEGTRTSFPGKVISVVPGYPEWYNIKYVDDPSLYVFKIQDDVDAGDLVFIEEGEGNFLELSYENLFL